MKPDVLKQIKEIEAKRAEMIRQMEEQQKMNGPIMMSQNGGPPVQLNSQQIVQIIEQQKKQIQEFTKRNEEQQRFIQLLQQKVIDLNKNNKSNPPPLPNITDNETLIQQIKALTLRNEMLEEKLSLCQSENEKLKTENNKS